MTSTPAIAVTSRAEIPHLVQFPKPIACIRDIAEELSIGLHSLQAPDFEPSCPSDPHRICEAHR